MSNYGATLKMQINDEEVKKMSLTTNKFTDENKRSLDNDEKSIPDIKSESQNFESDIGSKHNSFVLKQNGKDILSSFKKDKEQIDMSIIESNDSNIGREVSPAEVVPQNIKVAKKKSKKNTEKKLEMQKIDIKNINQKLDNNQSSKKEPHQSSNKEPHKSSKEEANQSSSIDTHQTLNKGTHQPSKKESQKLTNKNAQIVAKKDNPLPSQRDTSPQPQKKESSPQKLNLNINAEKPVNKGKSNNKQKVEDLVQKASESLHNIGSSASNSRNQKYDEPMMETITQVEQQNVLNPKEVSYQDEVSSNHDDMSPYFDDKDNHHYFPNKIESEAFVPKKAEEIPIQMNLSPKKQSEKKKTIK